MLAQTLNYLPIPKRRAPMPRAGLAEAAAEANNALEKIDTGLNGQLARLLEPRNSSDAALADQRDQYIDQLSQLMDIRVVFDEQEPSQHLHQFGRAADRRRRAQLSCPRAR